MPKNIVLKRNGQIFKYVVNDSENKDFFSELYEETLEKDTKKYFKNIKMEDIPFDGDALAHETAEYAAGHDLEGKKLLAILYSLDKVSTKRKKNAIIGNILEDQTNYYSKVRAYNTRHTTLMTKKENAQKIKDYFDENPDVVTALCTRALKAKYYRVSKKCIDHVMTLLNKSGEGKEIIKNGAKFIKNSDNIEEDNMYAYINSLAGNYRFDYTRASEYLEAFYTYDSKWINDYLTRKILKTDIENKIANLEVNEIMDFMALKREHPEQLSVLAVDQDLTKKSVKNGTLEMVSKMFDNSIEDYFAKRSISQCWDCHNGYPGKCEKVQDLVKKPLADYDFIEEGYQVEDESQKSYIVTKCNNFEISSEDEQVSASRLRAELQALRDFLDEDTFEDAKTRQYRLTPRH